MHIPNCPVAPICGGCPLMSETSLVARELYETRLRAALVKHLGTTVAPLEIGWFSLPQPEGYRRRIRMQVFADGTLGFFNPNKYPDCSVLTRSLREQLAALLAQSVRYREALVAIRYLELREADLDGYASVYLVKENPKRHLLQNELDQVSEWLNGTYWAIDGESDTIPWQKLPLPEAWQYVPIRSFLQINRGINDQLVTDLVNGAGQRSIATFCDLYAGSGNFTLPLLAARASGTSIEIDPDAVSALKQASVAQSLQPLEVSIGDAGAHARYAQSVGQGFDLVIVDPPRAGIRQDLSAMAAIAQRYLAYCSCNPETLARDLSTLCRFGFEIESVTLYDMFKHTAHVEALVWLKAPEHASR